MTEVLELGIAAVYENNNQLEGCTVLLNFGRRTYRLKVPSSERQKIDITDLADSHAVSAIIQKGGKYLAKAEAKLEAFRRLDDIIFGFEELEAEGQEKQEGEKAIFDVEIGFEIKRDKESDTIRVKHEYQAPET